MQQATTFVVGLVFAFLSQVPTPTPAGPVDPSRTPPTPQSSQPILHADFRPKKPDVHRLPAVDDCDPSVPPKAIGVLRSHPPKPTTRPFVYPSLLSLVGGG